MATLFQELGRATRLIFTGKAGEAGDVLRQILRQYPNSPDALHLLSLVAVAQRKPKDAEFLSRKAIIASCIARGDVDKALGRRSEALWHYNQALLINPYDQDACDRIGEYYWHSRQLQQDDVEFRKPPLDFFRTPIGNYYLPSDAPRDSIIRRMKAGKIFEEEVVDVMRPYIKQGTAVLDVGANLGQMSIIFSKSVGPSGRVYSFEADPYICYVLRKNIDENSDGNVKVYNNAVYDKCDDYIFYPEQDFKRFSAYGSYGVDPAAKEGRRIPMITIDSLKIEETISLMKVDIQGSDLFALRGAVDTIHRNRMPIVFEFEEQFQEKFGTSFADYMKFVEDIGYRVETTINTINYVIVPREI
ncbi:FkbM family methyltransferase [Azospirillum sp. ST 5-10]|uniref:FkbM family methyltransferase n=1 Tax=unclassified Azospirillum TaxID=2630922 RepID=UPI003F4A3216